MPRLKACLVLPSVVAACVGWQGICASAERDKPLDSLEFHGRPLGYWVSQATAEGGPEDLEKTVAALSAAVLSGDPSVKVAAADAPAALEAGENILAIHGLNSSLTSSDFLIVAELVAELR